MPLPWVWRWQKTFISCYFAILFKSLAEAFVENYHGICPAPGYPACPDHSAKRGHPDSVYFNVGRIADDQVRDMAERRGVEEKALRRLLGPNL